MEDRLELAWAAGFFDGEGCSHLSRGRPRSPGRYLNLNVVQVELEPLERFQKALGGAGKIRHFYKGPSDNNPHRRPYHRWVAWGEDAKLVADLLLPLLSAPKRHQLEEALAGEVRLGGLAARSGENHWTKKYPEKARAHAEKMRVLGATRRAQPQS